MQHHPAPGLPAIAVKLLHLTRNAAAGIFSPETVRIYIYICLILIVEVGPDLHPLFKSWDNKVTHTGDVRTLSSGFDVQLIDGRHHFLLLRVLSAATPVQYISAPALHWLPEPVRFIEFGARMGLRSAPAK